MSEQWRATNQVPEQKRCGHGARKPTWFVLSNAPTGHDKQTEQDYGGHLVCESIATEELAQRIAAAPESASELATLKAHAKALAEMVVEGQLLIDDAQASCTFEKDDGRKLVCVFCLNESFAEGLPMTHSTDCLYRRLFKFAAKELPPFVAEILGEILGETEGESDGKDDV